MTHQLWFSSHPRLRPCVILLSGTCQRLLAPRLDPASIPGRGPDFASLSFHGLCVRCWGAPAGRVCKHPRVICQCPRVPLGRLWAPSCTVLGQHSAWGTNMCHRLLLWRLSNVLTKGVSKRSLNPPPNEGGRSGTGDRSRDQAQVCRAMRKCARNLAGTHRGPGQHAEASARAGRPPAELKIAELPPWPQPPLPKQLLTKWVNAQNVLTAR